MLQQEWAAQEHIPTHLSRIQFKSRCEKDVGPALSHIWQETVNFRCVHYPLAIYLVDLDLDLASIDLVATAVLAGTLKEIGSGRE